MSENKTFRIGITMAGAVSAGAYTGGFMDYLMETLQLWENKKEKNRKVGINSPDYDREVPMYDVIIDVVGGASAGGITSMMTLLEMMKGHQPVKQPSEIKTGNIFYDTWVLLDDDSQQNKPRKVLDKMVAISDIKNDGIPSLLNSSFIDEIADNVFEKNIDLFDLDNLPSYISKDIYLLVTLCSVRGIPFEIEFDIREFSTMKDVPAHRMNEHMIIARFKLTNAEKDKEFPFDLKDPINREFLKQCAKATSAFPIGLAPRHFKNKFSKEYVKNNILANMGEIKSENLKIELKKTFFDFTAVDGGTINNEPFTQVLQQLIPKGEYNKKHPNYGVIMIDPFPNFYDPNENEEMKKAPCGAYKKNKKKSVFQLNMFDVLAKAYPMFQEQTRIKREPEFFGDEFKSLIYPVKKVNRHKPRPHPPMASAVLGGFGGFLDKSFRDHDYFLGRDNARNFLRGVFMLRYDKDDLHPLFSELSDEAFNAFKTKPQKKNNPERLYLFPIIPDFRNFKETQKEKDHPFEYTIEEFPKLSRKDLELFEPAFRKRIKFMIGYQSDIWLANKPWGRRLIKLLKGYLAKKASKSVIDKIENELIDRCLYK